MSKEAERYTFREVEGEFLRDGKPLTREVTDELNALAQRIEELTELSAVMYQCAGAYDMPLKVMDVLSAAQNGEEFSVEGILPMPSPSVEAVPGGYVVQCRDGGFGRVHETEQAARESIQRGGGSGNIRPVFFGSAPTPPASAKPKGCNRHGLDMGYFSSGLNILLRDMDNYTPSEMGRSLARYAAAADESVLRESEFSKVASAGGLDKGRLVKIAAELLGSGWASDVDEDWPNRVSSAKVAGQAAQDKERRRLMAIELREIFDIAQGGAQ